MKKAHSHASKTQTLNHNPFRGSSSSLNGLPRHQIRKKSSVLDTAPKNFRTIKSFFNEITFNFLEPERVGKFYRYDVDGLRGFACLLVAVFHIWVGRPSGGVDVFLSISGYFFIPSLLRKISNTNFRIHDFNPIPNIKNILRRLWPAMFVVLFAILLLGWKLLPQSGRMPLLHQIGASAGFCENWYMWKTNSSYLTAGNGVSPLQHMWSMAIQGQFFIATILIVLSLGFIIRLIVNPTRFNAAKVSLWTMIFIITVVTIYSFIYANYAMKSNATLGYFDTTARLWEPLAGGLIAIIGPVIVFPLFMREIISAIGIIAITLIGIFIIGTLKFPGPWALIPVLAGLGIILSYNPYANRTSMPIVNQILSGKIFQWFGRISYSLYLWHWPLLIFFLAWRPYITKPNILQGGAIIAISIALAWLTYIFVENPLRSTKGSVFPVWPAPLVREATQGFTIRGPIAKTTHFINRYYRQVLTMILTLFVVITTTTYTQWSKQYVLASTVRDTPPSLYPGAEAFFSHVPVPPGQSIQPPLIAAQYGDSPRTTGDGCILDFNTPGIKVCDQYGDIHAKRTVILAGGSHAEHWFTALEILAQKYGFRVITILRMGCELTTKENPLMPNGRDSYPYCAYWQKAAIAEIIKRKPDYLFTTVTRPNPEAPGDYVPNSYIGAFKELSTAKIQILGMRDTPWPHDENNHGFAPFRCLDTPNGSPYTCGVVMSSSLNDVNPAIEALKDYPNIKLLDMSLGLCEPEKDYCPAVVGNLLVWHDFHHLGKHFVATMAPELGRKIGKITRWWDD